jgi:hypothetical protein
VILSIVQSFNTSNLLDSLDTFEIYSAKWVLVSWRRISFSNNTFYTKNKLSFICIKSLILFFIHQFHLC